MARVATPIVIYRSHNREGETLALEPRSLRRLQESFPERAPRTTRIFVAYETGEDFKRIHGEVSPQVIMLLTGQSEQQLRKLGGVHFVDPVTDKKIPVES